MVSRMRAQLNRLLLQDQIFLAVIAVPVLILAAVSLYTVFRRKPEDAVRRYGQRAQHPECCRFGDTWPHAT